MIKSTIERFPSLPSVFMNEHLLYLLRLCLRIPLSLEVSPQEDVVNNLPLAALHLTEIRPVSSPLCPAIRAVIWPSTRFPSLLCMPHQSLTSSHQPPTTGKSFGKCHRESLGRQDTRKGTPTYCEKCFISLIVEVRRGKKEHVLLLISLCLS